MPTSPLTRLKRGSGHSGLLLLGAGSKEKRPVYVIGGSRVVWLG